MAHQDFEKYANEKLMNGQVADNWKKIFYQKILLYLPKTANNIKILDYGCGDGKYFTFFQNIFQKDNIFGVEISKTRIARANKKGWDKIYYIKELERLPFPDNYFDFINCDQVIEHIPCQKIDFYISELKRVLRNSGVIFFVTPNYPIKRLYDLITAILQKNLKRIKDDPTHICLYNFKKLNILLNKYFYNIELIPTGGLLHKYFRINFFSHKIFTICKNKYGQ